MQMLSHRNHARIEYNSPSEVFDGHMNLKYMLKCMKGKFFVIFYKEYLACNCK